MARQHRLIAAGDRDRWRHPFQAAGRIPETKGGAHPEAPKIPLTETASRAIVIVNTIVCVSHSKPLLEC